MTDYQDFQAKNAQEEAAFNQQLAEAYQREDERWSKASQATDWGILVTIGAIQWLWMFLVFLFEPGIR
jgi:hypothetical protein